MELTPGWVSAGVAAVGTLVIPWVTNQISAVKATQKTLFTKHDEVVKELSDYRLHVAETYVNREALKETLAPLKDSIERLANRIDAGHGN